MEYRNLGQSGLKVSEVCLGTMTFGGRTDEAESLKLVDVAFAHGVNFFDTADVYGGGRSESIIGAFLDDCSEEVFVATKLGRFEGYPDGYSLVLFRRCIENSLRRLKRDVIDLIQLHCIPQEYLENGEVFDWLRVLRDEGKIRAFGASVETNHEAAICLQQADIASLQIIFNIFRQQPADDFFNAAENNGTALIVRLPLASGLLAGKFTASTVFVPSDHRNYNRNGEAFSAGETFSGLTFSYGLDCVEKVRELVPSGRSMAQFALRWILDCKEVTVIIPGATKVAQVEGNTAASELSPLSQDIHKALRQLYDEKIASYIRGRM